MSTKGKRIERERDSDGESNFGIRIAWRRCIIYQVIFFVKGSQMFSLV